MTGLEPSITQVAVVPRRNTLRDRIREWRPPGRAMGAPPRHGDDGPATGPGHSDRHLRSVGVPLSRLIPRPSGLLPLVGWWAIIVVTSTAALVAVDRAARRLLPLVAPLRLSMVFPDRAPSRFGIAFGPARPATSRSWLTPASAASTTSRRGAPGPGPQRPQTPGRGPVGFHPDRLVAALPLAPGRRRAQPAVVGQLRSICPGHVSPRRLWGQDERSRPGTLAPPLTIVARHQVRDIRGTPTTDG